MFERSPVIKLSSAHTSQPSSNNRSHRCDPRNPAPPVTTALMLFLHQSKRPFYREAPISLNEYFLWSTSRLAGEMGSSGPGSVFSCIFGILGFLAAFNP